MKSVSFMAYLSLAITVAVASSQLQQPGTTVAGEMLHLDMGRQEALKQLAACCKIMPLGDNEIIVQNRKLVSHELGGAVYFEHAKVAGLAADRDFTTEESSYETGLTFYRLVDQMAKSKWTRGGVIGGAASTATIQAYSVEAANGSSKYVVVEFPDGRSIRLEIDHPDPGAEISQQTVVSECVGNCADW